MIIDEHYDINSNAIDFFNNKNRNIFVSKTFKHDIYIKINTFLYFILNTKQYLQYNIFVAEQHYKHMPFIFGNNEEIKYYDDFKYLFDLCKISISDPSIDNKNKLFQFIQQNNSAIGFFYTVARAAYFYKQNDDLCRELCYIINEYFFCDSTSQYINFGLNILEDELIKKIILKHYTRK